MSNSKLNKRGWQFLPTLKNADEVTKKENMAQILLNVAKKEREVLMQQNGREPTDSEVKRLAEMIMRQAQTAHIILRWRPYKGGSRVIVANGD